MVTGASQPDAAALGVAHRLLESAAADGHRDDRRAAPVALLAHCGLGGLGSGLGVRSTEDDRGRVARAVALHQTLLLERAQEISARLSAAGVEHLFVKGVALLRRLYRPGDRVISDIDLHIRPRDHQIALWALSELGYTVLPERDQAGPEELRSTLALERDPDSPVEGAAVDLHWGLDPLHRLLPRPDLPLPERVWEMATAQPPSRLPAPADEHHCAIIAHHLVHSDLLHLRSLVDVVLLFDRLPPDAGAEYLGLCDALGIGRFGGWLAGFIAREFEIERPAAIREGRVSGYLQHLTLRRWARLVMESQPDRNDAITLPRIRWRVAVLGLGAVPGLLADALLPPPAFLRWRWPGLSPPRALIRHYGQLVRKVGGG